MILNAKMVKLLAQAFVVSEVSGVLDQQPAQSPRWSGRYTEGHWWFVSSDPRIHNAWAVVSTRWTRKSECWASSQSQSFCPWLRNGISNAAVWDKSDTTHYSQGLDFSSGSSRWQVYSQAQLEESQEVKWLKNWCTAFSLRNKWISFFLITKTVTAFCHVKTYCNNFF